MKNFYLSIIYSDALIRYRSLITFVFMLSCVIFTDLFIFQNLPLKNFEVLKDLLEDKNQIVLEFAPEIWLTLLGLVLGTLIVVISIASQNTPKLIDLYIDDTTSLMYVWYITAGSLHNVYLQLFSNVSSTSFKLSVLLNTYLMLPIALLLAIPYVIYILRYTKTLNVIDRIYKETLRRLGQLKVITELENEKLIADYQFRMFEALNQLDDLLEFVAFKEPKAEIISRISLIIQNYVNVKHQLGDNFFNIRETIQNDVSFRTMKEQFAEMEKTKTFYEQKGFRLLGDAYLKLIENGDFALASLCAYEISVCGGVAVKVKDEALLNIALIRFNTILRFGIKHGLRNSGEARNVYNAVFHYSEFINHIISEKNTEFIKKSCFYINIYTKEIYRHSLKEPNFTFLVDVFTWETKKVLVNLHHQDIPKELQNEVLNMFLQIDNLSDNERKLSEDKPKYNVNVRLLQISLALYYLKMKELDFVGKIIQDIREDADFFGQESLNNSITGICNQLRAANPTFWEDTDRGNSNLYFSENKAYIDEFLELFNQPQS